MKFHEYNMIFNNEGLRQSPNKRYYIDCVSSTGLPDFDFFLFMRGFDSLGSERYRPYLARINRPKGGSKNLTSIKRKLIQTQPIFDQISIWSPWTLKEITMESKPYLDSELITIETMRKHMNYWEGRALGLTDPGDYVYVIHK
tara:strand:+ start:125 stop:553 length:429 start_codon:yes stop_codon:yes gene_type:complete